MWDFESSIAKKYFGVNLKKAKRNYDKELLKTRNKFIKDYPYAKVEEFEFWVNLSKTGDISDETEIVFKGSGNEKLYNLTGTFWKSSWDINSNVFKYKYADALHWGPSVIWNPTKTVKVFEISDGTLELDNIRIYVNQRDSFLYSTEALDIKYEQDVKDVRNTKIDKDDSYFASLIASYIISQKSGICLEHLKENSKTPKIVTSIMNFYVYYHMKRFLQNLDKMTRYITQDMLDEIQSHLPVRKIWTKKTHFGKEIPSVWVKTQQGRTIRNAKSYGSRFGGQIGIEYEELDKVVPSNEKSDWKKFFQDNSNGITKVGQLLLQKATEAYVYCILGAQAQTRWKIVGAGAKSLQTQEIFGRLVNDTVIQDDDTVLITNMRTAIKTTNVVLNLAIMPNLILIPSDLIILKQKISGYNNVLTLATRKMNFGVNKDINFDASKVDVKADAPPTPTPKVMEVFKKPNSNINNELSVVFFVLSGVGGLMSAWLF